jgi:hypothetical protein
MNMDSAEFDQRRSAAVEEFNQHEHRDDGPRVADALCGGLTVLRDSLYVRVHDDVQQRVGLDSMLMPLSLEKTERAAKLETELYFIAVSAAAAAERGYVATKDDWYLRWLARFRLGRIPSDGKTTQRLQYYMSKTADGRRLAFSNVLSAALPQSRQAPLVLFRLLQPAVQIVTALAFADEDVAAGWRDQQAEYLPAIRDCHACHGQLLDDGEHCAACGNPLWKFDWLTAAD